MRPALRAASGAFSAALALFAGCGTEPHSAEAEKAEAFLAELAPLAGTLFRESDASLAAGSPSEADRISSGMHILAMAYHDRFERLDAERLALGDCGRRAAVKFLMAYEVAVKNFDLFLARAALKAGADAEKWPWFELAAIGLAESYAKLVQDRARFSGLCGGAGLAKSGGADALFAGAIPRRTGGGE